MNTILLIILIILIIVAVIVFISFFKPYIVKYDTTLAFTGGLGTGKTLNAVKTAVVLWKKTRFIIWFKNKIIMTKNKINARHNIKVLKTKKGKLKPIQALLPKPWIYSNIPICMNKRKNLWSRHLTKEHLMLKERITEYSIVVIDELPQMINQFNWNIKDVQNNVNEFITFFRQYINGYFIVTAQSIDDVVAQIRRKLNTYYWLFDFQKFLWIFYKVRICSLQTSDLVTSTTTTFIEDNTAWKYGIIWHKYYDSRCFSERYDEVIKENNKRYKRYKTNKIIRFSDYESPLDRKEQK